MSSPLALAPRDLQKLCGPKELVSELIHLNWHSHLLCGKSGEWDADVNCSTSDLPLPARSCVTDSAG